jgi:hypothetical protein
MKLSYILHWRLRCIARVEILFSVAKQMFKLAILLLESQVTRFEAGVLLFDAIKQLFHVEYFLI